MEEEKKYYTFECGDADIAPKHANIPDRFSGITHDDFLDRPAVTTFHWTQPKEFIKCPECGELAKLSPEILTSLPPQRHWICEHCGKDGFIFCKDAHIVYDSDRQSIWQYNGMPSAQSIELASECMVCGEPTSVGAQTDSKSHMCEKCKKAILKMRRLMEED